MMQTKLEALFIRGLVVALVTTFFCQQASAAEVDFKGKTITIIIPSNVGGGTDGIGRLMGRFLHEYLPGKPTVIYSNIPGSAGIKALNYFVQQVKPDGLTSFSGSASNIEPTVLRSPAVQYDSKKLMMYGGFPAPTALVILRKQAITQFHDKSLAPAVMGDVTADRTTDQMAVWGPNYLNWNVRWVLGYPGTKELVLAIMRGEIDLMVTYGDTLIGQLNDAQNFTLVAQTGESQGGKLVRSARFKDVPVFSELIRPKLKDSRELKAFEAWETLARIGKWIALPPNTPTEIVGTYRQAFTQIVKDEEFKVEALKILGEDFTTATGEEMQSVTFIADSVTDDKLRFFAKLKENIGLSAESASK